MSDEKTYRSYNGRVVDDNMVLNINVRFLINCIVGLGVIGMAVFRYETRLREIESRMAEHNESITNLVNKHIEEERVKFEQMEEELKWHQKLLKKKKK